ncbi:MAG: hypothetical protein IJW24_03055, partial [Clostridia bacterium]|nr:hypothetical protein [Clostridia bacterium]
MDNNNQNMNKNNGSSPVSKISAEELQKIKAEMNGETVSAGEERKAESLETKAEQAGKTDEPRKSSDMGGMMDFVSGLLAKRRQEKKAEQESQGDQAAENQSEVLAQAEANQQASVNQAEEDQKASDHAIDLEVIAPSNTEEKAEVQATPIVSEVKPEAKVQVSQSSNDQRGEMEFKEGALAEAEKTEAQKVVPSVKDLKCVTDDLVITPDDGTYTSNLDFTKNMSIMKTKLPLPKLPFIIAGGVALLVGLIVGIIFIVEATRPPEPVVLTSAKLNVESIDAGFVGDELDLR